MKKIFATLLIILLLSMTFSTTANCFNYGIYGEEFSLYQYIADIYSDSDNPTYKGIVAHQNIEKMSQIWVKNLTEDSDFMSSVQAWEILTFTPGDTVKDHLDRIGYYDAIIFGVLDKQLNSADTFNDINNNIVKQSAKLSKALSEYFLKSTEIDITNSDGFKRLKEENPGEFEKRVKVILGDELSSKIKGAIEIYDVGTEIYTTLTSYCDYLYAYQNIADMSDSYKIIFDTMINQCTNNYLRDSLQNVRNSLESDFDAILTAAKQGTLMVSANLFKSIVNDVFNKALWAINPFLGGLSIGQAIGSSLSNFLFSTDETIEKFYAMQAMVNFEDLLCDTVNSLRLRFRNTRNDRNAIAYLESVYMLYDTYILNCEYAIEFTRIQKDGSFIAKINKNDNGYDSIIKSCNFCKDIYISEKQCLSNNWIFYLEEDYPEYYPVIVEGEHDPMVNNAFPIYYHTNSSTADFIYTYQATDEYQDWYLPELERPGYVFDGWYIDNDCSTPIMWNTDIYSFSELFAKWIRVFDYETIDNEQISITGLSFIDDSHSDLTIFSEMYGYSVSKIDVCAFVNEKEITSISIPSTVSFIDKSAFYGCSGLTNINIPNSVTYIGASAFEACTNLTNITISNNISSLEDNTFTNCSSLKSITIPDSVTSIGKEVFSKCDNLATIKVDDNNNYYRDIDGVLFTKDKKTLVTYPGGGATSYTIPDGVITIPYYAFLGCNNLTNLTVADSVKNIGAQAFIECPKLTHVKMGDGIEDISAVFLGAYVKTVEFGSGIKNIGQEAFYGSCITEIVIPEGVESIDYWAFACSSLTSITIPDSVKTIDGDAFEDCYNLKNLYITSLESWFECCSFTSHPLRYGGRSGDGKLYINGVLATDIVIPDTVSKIASGAFHNCGSIKSINIPNSVTSIGSQAFYGCSSLTNIIIPNSVSKIDYGVFNNCNNLECIYIYRDGYANEYCLADETLKTKIKYIPTETEFMVFEGYQTRYADYNGLRSRFVVDLTAIPTMEDDGFDVLEYGAIFVSTDKLNACGDEFAVTKNESGVYETVSYGKLISIMKNGSLVGKYINDSEDQLTFVCSVTNFTEDNFDKEISIRGYAVLIDASGNEYVVYCDYPNESYRSVSLAMICDALALDGKITETNISYSHILAFRKKLEEA